MILIFVASLGFALIDYTGLTFPILQEGVSWKMNFLEVWGRFISYSLGGLIGYYFVSLRWNQLSKGDKANSIDVILILVFAMCITGILPHFLKNLTQGINAILKGILG